MTPDPSPSQPVAYMTREAVRRLADGGNCKGAVPVHLKRSKVACIPLYADQPARIASLEAELVAARSALDKIHAIRNDIISRQKLGWSAHVYPLVVVLSEAGYEYDGDRASLGATDGAQPGETK